MERQEETIDSEGLRESRGVLDRVSLRDRAVDPYAEPPLPPPEKSEWQKEEQWRKHVKEIERRGERYGHKTPNADGIY
jgi:hypothetical protein